MVRLYNEKSRWKYLPDYVQLEVTCTAQYGLQLGLRDINVFFIYEKDIWLALSLLL